METAGQDGSKEHRDFVPLIAAIERVEDSVGEAAPPSLRIEASGLHDTLAHELIPHAVSEGRTVFPVLRRVTGTDHVTREMNSDHKEIARLTDELDRMSGEIAAAGLDTAHERRLRKVLHELRAVVQHHFSEEEQGCFQVLKTELGPDEARAMYEAMERAAAELRSLYE